MSVFFIAFRDELKQVYYALKRAGRKQYSDPVTGLKNLARHTQSNYGDQIDQLARDFGISSAYLKALISLEVGGKKPAPTRFERHVYSKLKLVRAGERSSYEMLKKKTIEDASDEALKNLATSWGAFQIMGYKCVQLGVKVSDIRGDHSIYWGVKWIVDEYGYLLRSGRYKDAFHYHNTGRLYPRNGSPLTYHKNYVPNGLKYMQIFEGLG